jgi:hypothetical protein
MKFRNLFALTLLAAVAVSCSPSKPSIQTEVKPEQEVADAAALIQVLDAGNPAQVLEILKTHGLDSGTLGGMKGRLGKVPARAKLRERFLHAAIIGSLGALEPEELKTRLAAAASEHFQPVCWEINSFGPDWQRRYDQERARFAVAPIGVLDVGLADTNFVRFFQWYDRYGDKLHSVVINWERLDNYDFKQSSQQQEANKVMSGLYKLIKARNPSAFVWVRVVWADDNSDVRWLKVLTFAPDGLLLWNLPAFDSPFEAARGRYLPLLDPACPMVAASFYGVWSRINNTKDLAGIGRTTDANLGALEKRLAGAGLRGLMPDGLMLKAVALAKAKPAKPAATATNSDFALNLASVLGSYEKAGRKKPAWDKPVKEALTLYAQQRGHSYDEMAEIHDRTSYSLYTAMEAGCDDPLVQFLYTRGYMHPINNDTLSFVQTSIQAADALEQSAYSEVWKFAATLRTAEVLTYASRNSTNYVADLDRFRGAAATHLVSLISDKKIPEHEGRLACQDWMKSRNLRQAPLKEAYDTMEQPLFERWPDSGWALALRGQFYIDYAWQARGNGLANTVSEQGWKLLAERLEMATVALEKAWQLDSTLQEVPLAMLRVELGQGQGRERMELWFRRAMKLNPANWNACLDKLYYLEPKWHGSPKAMIDFGRECVASEEWGGQVPLILYWAHNTICNYLPLQRRDAYWRQPEVWPDVKAAFDKFFELNPDATSWHHTYARVAFACQQWEELNRQLALLGPVDYNSFGGREAFNDMVRRTKEHTGQSPK